MKYFYYITQNMKKIPPSSPNIIYINRKLQYYNTATFLLSEVSHFSSTTVWFVALRASTLDLHYSLAGRRFLKLSSSLLVHFCNYFLKSIDNIFTSFCRCEKTQCCSKLFTPCLDTIVLNFEWKVTLVAYEAPDKIVQVYTVLRIFYPLL